MGSRRETAHRIGDGRRFAVCDGMTGMQATWRHTLEESSRSARMAVTVFLSAVAAAPADGQSACHASASDSVAVRRVAEGIVAADNARELSRVLLFYAPDAVLHPPGEPPVRGRDQIRPRYEGLFAGYDPEIVTSLEAIDLCGDLAVVSGRNGGVLRGRNSVPDRPLSDTFVMVLERVAGTWSIRRLIWHPDRPNVPG